jgi:tRNA pseudouridine55 synthase
VGHTGTLDPFATGLLVVLIGRATRVARFIEQESKTYLATARLGTRTDTDDLTGRIVAEQVVNGAEISEARVRHALADFLGSHMQRPPQYSAKHVGGERSYHKARRGERVALEPVAVTVQRIDLVEYRPPDVTFRVVVSPGTYIRAIARDLGEQLGVGAHLVSLRREAIGAVKVESATPLAQLGLDALQPVRNVLGNLPFVQLDESGLKAVVHGRAVEDRGAVGRRGSEPVALMSDGELVAVARPDDGWLRPIVVLAAAQ